MLTIYQIWCPFFLIAASLLPICSCWCSPETWLCSLQTYVGENSFWGNAWYVKDVFLTATTGSWALNITEQSAVLLKFWNKKKKDCMFNKPWLLNCSVCVFSNKHPQRIVCDKLVLFPTGWFLGWAISFLKSVSCSVLQGEYMNIVISMHKVYRNLTTKASWIMLLWIWACTMVSRTHSPMFTCLVSDSYGKVCFSFCFLWKCDKICW